jgi:hypothetical protein
MPPPAIFVMSTEATGPRHDRRPAGVLHAAPSTHPPTNTTFCGQANGLYWFGGVAFAGVAGTKCAACLEAVPGARTA